MKNKMRTNNSETWQIQAQTKNECLKPGSPLQRRIMCTIFPQIVLINQKFKYPIHNFKLYIFLIVKIV